LVPKFEQELQKVGGKAYRAATKTQLDEVLRAILTEADATSVVLSRNPLISQTDLQRKLESWGVASTVWPSSHEGLTPDRESLLREAVFAAPVGITGVDFILAESGTLVLSSLTEGWQLASLAPPIHLALYRQSQVLGSMEEVLERLPVARDPDLSSPGRSVVFITGTSRTADIEQILVHGVHGPREVHAILLENTCLE
jgi:L-lactate dehydrogenase complex protein LldG